MIQVTKSLGQRVATPHLVAIGASAGGLKALEELFDNLPPDTGLAFVVVQHLSPDFKSLMKELLSRRTSMEVCRVHDGMLIQPDSVYLIPPKKTMTVNDGRLVLTDQEEGALRLPINAFFESMSQQLGSHSVGVVLSGTGSDGTSGVQAIHDVGGLVVVQDPVSAEFDGMPRSAIATHNADFVLAPREIAKVLAQYAKSSGEVWDRGGTETFVGKVVELLDEEGELDFSLYKKTTMLRRIRRRMVLSQTLKEDDYLILLSKSEDERFALRHDLLIRVTAFFRDPEAWDGLYSEIRQIVRESSGEVRMWVGACGTGPEAYTLAILLVEAMEEEGRRLDCKIFATDVDSHSLEVASAGIYGDEVLDHVSPERRKRFFLHKDGRFEIAPEIRQIIIFASHDLTRDTPFTRMQLVSCRNVLIYMEPPLQDQVLTRLHYALVKDGKLFLGPSETLGSLAKEFQAIDGKWRIFSKVRERWIPLELHTSIPAAVRGLLPTRKISRARQDSLALQAAESLYSTLGAVSIVVSDRREVQYVFGSDLRVLATPRGRVSDEVEQVLQPAAASLVDVALGRLSEDKGPILYRSVHLGHSPEEQRTFDVTFRSLLTYDTMTLSYLVVFIPAQGVQQPDNVVDYDDHAEQRLKDLEVTLSRTRESLQATIEELETTNEEQQSTNEELVAANEELQSTNEELHSVNEELHTVNAEFQQKIQELTRVNNDLDNLIECTGVGTVFLDQELKIRRFTPPVTAAIHIARSDLGRPVYHLAHNLSYDGFEADLRTVLDTSEVVERSVETRSGQTLLLKVSPYTNEQSEASGIAVTFVDVTALERAEASLRQSQQLLQDTMNALSAHIAILDEDGKIIAVNQAWERFGAANGLTSKCGAVGSDYRSPLREGDEQDQQTAEDAYQSIGKLLSGEIADFSLEYPCHGPDQLRWFLMRASAFEHEGQRRVVVAHVDISQRCIAEQALASNVETLRLKNEEMEQFIYTVSHDLKSPLVTIAGLTGVLDLEIDKGTTQKARDLLSTIKGTSDHMRQTISDLLEYIRVGNVEVEFDLVPVVEVLQEVLEKHAPLIEEKQLKTRIPKEELQVLGDRVRVTYVLDNLLVNAIRHGCPTPGSRIEVFCRENQDWMSIHVRDQGPGIPLETQNRIFGLFERGTADSGGTGVGLAIVKRVMESHGGDVSVSSSPGCGAEFVVRFPKAPPERVLRRD